MAAAWRVVALATEWVRRVQAGGPDDYGLVPGVRISDGDGAPCRHCLHDVPAGARMLVVAHRPFATLTAYAETGPIFLCADACPRWEGAGLPPTLGTSPAYLIRGYDAQGAIVYGTGAVVATPDLGAQVGALVTRGDVAWVHVRSARNGCFQARIERA